MKKFLLPVALLLTSGIQALAQSKDSVQLQAAREEYLTNFQRALRYDDMMSAAYALNGYLAHGGSSNYRDTLAIVYYRTGNLSGAFKLANEMYTDDNKNVAALTLLADISGRAGETKTSLDWYEKLCALNPGPYNHYQLATRQFMLERVGECRQSLEKVISDSANAMKEMVSLEVQPGNSENVPALAAAYNMLGALAFKENKKEDARKYYESALKAFPEFIIARQNLEGLNAKPATKAPVKSPAKSNGNP